MRKYKKLSIYKYAAQRHQKIDALNESFTAHIRKPPRSVEILDEAKLPEKYIKITRTADKTAIRTLLKAGIDFPCAKLTYSEVLNILWFKDF